MCANKFAFNCSHLDIRKLHLHLRSESIQYSIWVLLVSPASIISRWLSCLRCGALNDSPFSICLHWEPHPPHLPQEAAKEAVLVLQSIFWGSDGVKVTPKPVKNAIQESKHGNPRVFCTYCTGRSGLNLWTEETDTWVRMKVPKSLQLQVFGIQLTFWLWPGAQSFFLYLQTCQWDMKPCEELPDRA